MLPSPGRSVRQRRHAQGGAYAARAAGAAAAAPLPQWDDWSGSFLQPFRPITWMSNTLPRRASVSSTLCLSEGSLEDLEHDLAAADEYNYNNIGHPKAVLEGLNELRDDAVFCDVIIRVGEQTFPAHKCVLAAFSPYFKAMFTSQLKECHDREVTLKDIEPIMLETLLQFAYTGSVSITQGNVQNLMAASNLLQVLSVRDACSLFMEKHMDASNCLGIHCFAETMNCERLQRLAKEFALSNFPDVSSHEEFLNLSLPKLVEFVSSDELQVAREEDVFTAVLNWFNHQPDARKEGFYKVLENVRLPLLSPYFLHDCVSKQKVVRTSPECQTLLEEARLYHLLPDRRGDMQGARTRPRKNAELVDVIVCAGGEDDRVVLRCMEGFNPADGQWASLGNLPFAVSKHGAVVTGKNVLYFAGGEFPDGNASNRLLRFDPQLNKWEEMASMAFARSELGLAVLDGFLYAAGGWDGSARLDSVERYNTETNSWEQLPPLKVGITSAAVAAHDGFLYVAGGAIGEDGDGITCVQRFDPRTHTWAELAPMLIPRSGSAACVLDGKIYIIGGWHGATENTNKVECYDIHKNQWNPCSPMRACRYQPGAAVMNGHIYVLGGEEGWDLYHKSVERYTPSTDRWEDATEMGTPRSWLTCNALQVRKSLLIKDRR
ncbi:kelch-like protein diablo isoform X2 [Amphibalanus amphitrite]|nr:kelch-like protein diablo isoform X2 [Amphibalanus amphitrite]XP_043247545.1 kelch-like protein diablo isoform X2 [Amphibalanus amphitrite]XP_043247546.1 kelch-like protein diablo isoform X2 [Amphibalanus amphitrite]XP_043247547.1 kelch-like protein diablo isoform X2 [Amphibalanus amphitrite]XP_043247548.1 kelch-like protein diablo isoform X2 [Amphibalanus amphitrite]